MAAQSKVRMTTFKHLADKGELGVVMVRLMMFVNDLTLCNDSMEQWHKYGDLLISRAKPGQRCISRA